MLASRERNEEERQQNTDQNNDVFSNIFAGLTFPDAPKNTFIEVRDGGLFL